MILRFFAHPDALTLLLLLPFTLGVVAFGFGVRRFLRERDAELVAVARKAAQEENLRLVWCRRAVALGLQPRDDESTDELIERVMATRLRGRATAEFHAAVQASRDQER